MASKITFDYGDNTYDFCLRLGELKELEQKTNVGPFTLLNRLLQGDWRAEDAREVIRLGLIGGGKTPLEALNIVRTYTDEQPLIQSIEPALRILSHAVIGNQQEQENAPPQKKTQKETPVI
jgi:hypothetical protein